MNNKISACAEVDRQVASVVVMNKAANVFEQAESLLGYIDNKLRTITMQSTPQINPATPQINPATHSLREMPEFFHALDEKLDGIRSSLDTMRDIIDRVELE